MENLAVVRTYVRRVGYLGLPNETNSIISRKDSGTSNRAQRKRRMYIKNERWYEEGANDEEEDDDEDEMMIKIILIVGCQQEEVPFSDRYNNLRFA